MAVLYLGMLGFSAFVLVTAIMGTWLRRHPSKVNAEKSSRVMHFLFFAGLVAPSLVCAVYPGITRMDGIMGLKSLPWKTIFFIAGVLVLMPGLYLLVITNKLLRTLGSGANAFRLTQHIVGTG